MIDVGMHKGTVTNHRWRKSQSKGTLGLDVTVEITNDEGQAEELTGTIWFTEKSMRFARAQLKALDFDPDKYDIKEIGDSISLLGLVADVSVIVENYQGQDYTKIDRFGAGAQPPKPEDFTAVQAALVAAGSKAGKAETPEPEDEIPF